MKNGDGQPLRYQTIQARWAGYCAEAGVNCSLHQLRHSHATALVKDGVSLATIRKRFGHKHIQTTLRGCHRLLRALLHVLAFSYVPFQFYREPTTR